MSASRILEAELYPFVQSYLNINFSSRLKPALGSHLPLVSITATAGPASSGTWSRPDLAMINFWRHKFQPVGTLDLYGFEVKRDGGCDLKSVHETLAHTRLVHFAYLVWHYCSADHQCDAFRIIHDNCAAYGLGLITFFDHLDGNSFKIHVDARRASPQDHDVDDFIETRFSEQQKNRLLAWIEERR